MVVTGRPALSSIVPGSGINSPGIRDAMVLSSADGIVQGHELGAVGKDCFDLNLIHQLWHAFHHLIALQPGGALLHQLSHTLPVAGAFQHQEAQPCHGLGMIELQTALDSSLRQQGGGHDQELVLFLGTEMHFFAIESTNCSKQTYFKSLELVSCSNDYQNLFIDFFNPVILIVLTNRYWNSS